jgi:hypothetical protein
VEGCLRTLVSSTLSSTANREDWRGVTGSFLPLSVPRHASCVYVVLRVEVWRVNEGGGAHGSWKAVLSDNSCGAFSSDERDVDRTKNAPRLLCLRTHSRRTRLGMTGPDRRLTVENEGLAISGERTFQEQGKGKKYQSGRTRLRKLCSTCISRKPRRQNRTPSRSPGLARIIHDGSWRKNQRGCSS